jgi:hypothetical protein
LWRLLAIFFNGILPVVILCCLLIPIQPLKNQLRAKFRQKEKLKTKQIRKRSDIGGVQSPEVRKKKRKNRQIHIFWYFIVGSQRYRKDD